MKSHASMLLAVAENIFKDVYSACAANESAGRDLDVLRSRTEHEGLSFLTITLPSFGQDFERSLADGRVDSKYFLAFKKYRRIPAFMRGIFSLVFSADTGDILPIPDISAIKGIRQIAYTFKKLKLPCALHRVHKAFAGYVQDERCLEQPLDQVDIDHFCSVSDILWGPMLNADLSVFDTIPKHGPGATAERISGNQKYVFRNWHERLQRYFPFDSNALGSINALDEGSLESTSFISEEQEMPVRVITVPKTLKTPRIIAIEPVCMQYTQQALSRLLISSIERYRMTSGHVNFTDQSVNRNLAMMSSKDRSLATLDLSSASDRVPASLVFSMLRTNPEIQGAVFACRSKTARLPNDQVIDLKKFASMGSALCFPIESMYFYTICVAARLAKHELPVTSRNIYRMSRDVYVYGDDIIVPTDEAASVIGHLQKYYCKVNVHKSFWSGNFRESCGMDAFLGEDVTPTYLREMPPDDRRSSAALISWVETSNLLYKSGYWLTSSLLLKRCERLLGVLPIIKGDSALLGKVSFQRYVSCSRISRRYHAPEVRGWVACPVYRKDKLDGYPALLKCLLRLERSLNDTNSDARHLSRTARHGAVALKRRWAQPY